MPQTLAEKVWERHVVHRADGEPDLLYVDLHLVHEVTSPQAFDGLRAARPPGPPAGADGRDDGPQRAHHRRPRDGRDERPPDGGPPAERRRVRRDPVPVGLGRAGHRPTSLRTGDGLHAARHDDRCGDSHTSTHGAFGALAFGIGTSEVEHVLATQTPAADEGQDDGGDRRRRAALGVQRQGHHPRDHQPNRDRRRRRPRASSPRLRDPRALDGGPDDDLQHVDRGRRARRHGRPTTPPSPTSRGERTRRKAPTGSPRSMTGGRCPPTRVRCSTPR